MTTVSTPCTQCGAKLEFAPGQHALQCPYCGARNAIAQAEMPVQQAAVEELDYPAYLAQQAGQEPQLEQQAVKCPSCNAESTFPAHVVADRCPFCATPIVARDAYASRKIRPRAIAPFEVTEAAARNRFKDWIGGLWFAPNALKQAYRSSGGLKGLYIPWWTYDAHSDTPYQGERGDNYLSSEQYSENGVSKTRQVQKIRWQSVSGQVHCAFDDVLVNASRSLPSGHAAQLAPWRLDKLQPYQDDFVAGFTVEAYQVGLEPGFAEARSQMEQQIRSAICRDIGGDHQRIQSMQPRYSQIHFKHILLPVWLSAYRYSGKTYRFLVNGQTGTVQGERPYSAWKIAGALLGALLVAYLLYVLTRS